MAADISFPNLTTWLTRSGVTVHDADLGELKGCAPPARRQPARLALAAQLRRDAVSSLEGSLINYRRLLASLENLSIYLKLLQKCEMDVPPPPASAQAWGAMKYPRWSRSSLGAESLDLFSGESVRVEVF